MSISLRNVQPDGFYKINQNGYLSDLETSYDSPIAKDTGSGNGPCHRKVKICGVEPKQDRKC